MSTAATWSSIILCVVALLSTTIVEADDEPYVRPIIASSCSKINRTEGDQALRHAGLNALQYAINQYTYDGLGAVPDVNCVTDPTDTVYGYTSSVKCRGYKKGPPPTVTECYNCLYNAQFRLVDIVCKDKVGGQIELESCVMAYYDYGYPCPGSQPEISNSP